MENMGEGKHVCFDGSADYSWRLDTYDNVKLLVCKLIAFSKLYFSF